MLLRVAEKAGMAYYGSTGQGKATVPVDAFNLDKCKRIVNDAFRLFAASSPPRGWNWKNRICDVIFDPTGEGADNIDSDPARYLLPADFDGQASGPARYTHNTNTGQDLAWVSEATIRTRRAVSVITGYPNEVAVRPYEPLAGVLGSSRRWELIVNPAPVAVDTIQFPYTSNFNQMECETGVATSGSATTLVDTGRLEANDYFNTWILRVVEGVGLGQTATITDYSSNGTFTFTGLSGGSTPDSTTVYYVEPAGNLHPAGVKFDDCVIAACYAEAEKQIEEINEGAVELFIKVNLPFAHKADSLTRPRTLRKSRVVRERTWNTVTTDHDLP
jgi:hypothetical protein